MFRFSRKDRPAARKSVRRSNLRFESLERREVMSATPVIFNQISEAVRLGAAADFGNTLATARAVATSPMMESKVAGSLSSAADVDYLKVHLEKGQIFTADVDFSKTAPVSRLAPKLTLFNSVGQEITHAGEEGIGYRIDTSGDYYVSMAATSRLGNKESGSANYTIHVRPIGLASNDLDPKWLQTNAQGIYVWQDGNQLNISGPVGHGFSIRGEWQKVTTNARDGSVLTTYSAQNNVVNIEAGNGIEIALNLGTVGISITTIGGQFGNLYGELKSTQFTAASELVDGLVREIDRVINEETPFDLDLDPQTASFDPDNFPASFGEIGLRLGNDKSLKATGAPLNAAVPYLFYAANVSVSGSYQGSFAGHSISLATLIYDPADPFVYVGSDQAGYGIGLSDHGLIPFTPQNTPSQYADQLFGHVYVAGHFNVTPALTVSGNIVVNLNGNGGGRISDEVLAAVGSVSNAISKMTNASLPTLAKGSGSDSSDDSSVDNSFWKSFSVGVNGTLNVDLSKVKALDEAFGETGGPKKASTSKSLTSAGIDKALSWLSNFELGSATAIYDGPDGGFYLRGRSQGILNDTPLDFLSHNDVDLDFAWLEGGHIFLDAEGEFDSLGTNANGRILLARDFKLPPELAALINGSSAAGHSLVTTTGGYLEMGLHVLGTDVTLKGHVRSNGDFELIGTTDVDLGLSDASATVRLAYSQTKGVTFEADLVGKFRIESLLRAKMEMKLKLAVDSHGAITYSGSGTAKIQAKVPQGVSTSGVDYDWETLVSVAAGVDNDGIWFKYKGKTYRIRLN